MQRKLELGAVFGEVFAIYRSQAGVLLPLAFTLFLFVAVLDDLIAGVPVLVPLGLAIGVLAGTLYQGIVVSLASDVEDGRRDSSVEELVRSAAPVVLPLIGAGLLAGLGIAAGSLLLVVPGLFLATIWAVIAPVIVVERSGVLASFRRSRELVRGNGWPVFMAIVIVTLITLGVAFLLASIAISLADTVAMRILSNVIASTLTAPIAALLASVLYFRLRELVPAPAAPQPPPAQPGPPSP